MTETKTDWDLLKQHESDHAEEAFAEIVRRHINLVYSAALRQVRSSQLAEEVAQSAFIDLARNAPRLAPGTVIVAWLYQVTRRTAIDVVRREARRQLREQIAGEMSAMNATNTDWTHIEPLLDEAMQTLDETDRAAVLLRYFENKSLREIGETLGASEDAAQKRVSRAVERLREFFDKQGFTMGTSGLLVAISANAVQAAPVGLATIIATAAGLVGTAAATAAVSKTLAMTTLQKAIVTAALTGAICAGIYQARQASSLRGRVLALQKQHSEQIDQLTRERDGATNRLASAVGEVATFRRDSAELVRLRGEVARLRAELQDLAKLKSEDSKKPTKSEAEALIDRVRLLKQRLEQTPEARIPELQFLTTEDWLGAASRKLDNDDDYRRAFADLRNSSEGHFLSSMETPLRKYIEANNNQFPNDLAQLKPHFEKPPGDDILQRYQIVRGKSVPGANILKDAGDWLIMVKSPIDAENEGQWALGRNGLSTFTNDSDAFAILGPAMKALADATPEVDGKKTMDMDQLGAYLTTPEQKRAYQKLMQNGSSGSK